MIGRQIGIALVALAGAMIAAPALAQNEQFIPALVYRTGAYAPNGVPYANGTADYYNLINERDGGINGVKIVFEECEFGYATDRGVECYERLKAKGPTGAAYVVPLSTGVTYALTEKTTADKIPVISAGYGRADSRDGTVFQWNFPLLGTYWTAADVILQHLAKTEGGWDKLKGKKIALVYHDSPYGKEPIALLQKRAQMHGFETLLLPVTHPGVEQKATWLQIRQNRSDYVLLWGWGVMNSTAIKEAVAVGYPREKMYGVWWSGAEPDVRPAEDGAKGYNAAALQHSAGQFKLHEDLKKHLYDKNKGAAKWEETGEILYLRGLITAMLGVEAIRTAQERFGKKPLTGEQVRWGFENLNLTAERLKELGFEGVLSPIKVTCADHEGARTARIQTWDGKNWKITSEWYTGDDTVLAPMVKEFGGQVRRREKDHTGELLISEMSVASTNQQGAASMPPPSGATSTEAVAATIAAPILSVNNIEVVYDHVILVLKGVSLQVPKGEIVALLGANGAGKSTTLKAISNLLAAERGEVTKGSIVLHGDEVHALTPNELVRRGCIQVMEGRHCFAHLSVEENLLTGAYTRRDGKAAIKRDLDLVYSYFPRLQDRRAALAGYTSGGEQQMCAIGRALMSRPQMILLDEPSMGLAPQLVEEIFEIVATLNAKEGVSFLLAEQNTFMALKCARYGYVLENGRVVLDGNAKALSENEDVKEFYLGIAEGRRKSFRDGKHYRRRKRWLA